MSTAGMLRNSPRRAEIWVEPIMSATRKLLSGGSATAPASIEAFGGEDLRTLYVTTASIVTPPGHRLAGSLFCLRTDTPGMAENLMAFP